MKTLDDFMENLHLIHGGYSITGEDLVRLTAAEILRVCEEYGEKDCPLKCEAHSEREKEIFSTGYEEGVWGLIDFLKSYIQLVKKESE